jgi:DNA invertase Pin-like site-specific DNA recombinase
VALISVAESLDTSSAAGRLVINIMAAVSQWEREAIGERTRDALRHKRSQNERVGNIAFGFRLAADGKHVEQDPGEQTVLAEIRRLRASGVSMRRIAVSLNRVRSERAAAQPGGWSTWRGYAHGSDPLPWPDTAAGPTHSDSCDTEDWLRKIIVNSG